MAEKTDIFSLYKREKEITHKDDTGNEVKILLVKMTSGERRKALDAYEEVSDIEGKRLQNKEDQFASFSNIVKPYTKNEFINGIMTFEEVERGRVIDLFPVEGEEELTAEQRKKKEDELLEKWRVSRRAEHDKADIEELKKILLNYLMGYQARVEAQRVYNLTALSFMCHDPETKQRTFESKEKVEEVLDNRILNWLIEELATFETVNNQKDVREVAESSDFPKTGQSQENGADSQPITE